MSWQCIQSEDEDPDWDSKQKKMPGMHSVTRCNGSTSSQKKLPRQYIQSEKAAVPIRNSHQGRK